MTTAGYSGTPLAKKLGIKPGARLLLVAAPEGFDVPGLPDGVDLRTRAGREPFDVIVLFCADLAALRRRFEPLIGSVDTAGALWVCWPKRASRVLTDVDENLVREHGLAAGLVDVKIAAINDVWSGLKFVRRLIDR